MVIYDNEALRSAQFDIACLVPRFFYLLSNASVLLSTFLPSDYDPWYRHIRIRQNAFIACVVCLCIEIYIVFSHFLHAYIYKNTVSKYNMISHLHQIKNHSHIVVAIRIQIYALMMGSKKETWIVLTLDTNFHKEKKRTHDRYITVRTSFSFSVAWKINL